VNIGYDAREIINARQGARAAQQEYRVPDEGNRFPASSACMFTPDGFKPVGFNKYNGKTRPQQ